MILAYEYFEKRKNNPLTLFLLFGRVSDFVIRNPDQVLARLLRLDGDVRYPVVLYDFMIDQQETVTALPVKVLFRDFLFALFFVYGLFLLLFGLLKNKHFVYPCPSAFIRGKIFLLLCPIYC